MKSKILLDFLRFNSSKLNSFATSVHAAMKDNAYFPEPMPSLAELTAGIELFAASSDDARHFDRLKAAEKDQARKKLELLLTRLSNYVMVIAGDNRVIQMSSGFHVNGLKIGETELGDPINFAVLLGKNSGEAFMSVDVANAKSYVYYVAEAGTETPVWKDYPSGVKPFLVTDLLPLKMYRFRITAVGNKGQSVETGEITRAIV